MRALSLTSVSPLCHIPPFRSRAFVKRCPHSLTPRLATIERPAPLRSTCCFREGRRWLPDHTPGRRTPFFRWVPSLPVLLLPRRLILLPGSSSLSSSRCLPDLAVFPGVAIATSSCRAPAMHQTLVTPFYRRGNRASGRSRAPAKTAPSIDHGTGIKSRCWLSRARPPPSALQMS